MSKILGLDWCYQIVHMKILPSDDIEGDKTFENFSIRKITSEKGM